MVTRGLLAQVGVGFSVSAHPGVEGEGVCQVDGVSVQVDGVSVVSVQVDGVSVSVQVDGVSVVSVQVDGVSVVSVQVDGVSVVSGSGSVQVDGVSVGSVQVDGVSVGFVQVDGVSVVSGSGSVQVDGVSVVFSVVGVQAEGEGVSEALQEGLSLEGLWVAVGTGDGFCLFPSQISPSPLPSSTSPPLPPSSFSSKMVFAASLSPILNSLIRVCSSSVGRYCAARKENQ